MAKVPSPSFGRWLTLGLLALAVLALVAGFTAFLASRSLLSTINVIGSTQERQLNEAWRLRDAMERRSSSGRGYLLGGEERLRVEAERAHAEVSAHLTRLRSQPGAEPERRLLDQIGRVESAHYRSLSDLMTRRSRGESTEKLAGAFEAETQPRWISLERAVDSLVAYHEGLLAHAHRVAREQVVQARRVITLIALTALLLFMGIVLVLRRTLLRFYRLERDARRAAESAHASAEALRAGEAEHVENTRLVVEYALDAVITIDTDSRVTSWNREAERMFGWTSAEIVGRPLQETILPARYREAHLAGLRRFLAEGEGPILNRRMELSAMRRDGSEFPIELAVTPIRRGEEMTFSAFVRDITERKSIQEQREQILQNERLARSEAEQALRIKDDFLSTISHELRTPLQAILGWARLLALEKVQQEQLQRGVQVIERNASIQAKLIEDLLETSRIMSGKVRLDLQRIDPRSVVEAAIQTVRPTADPKSIRIRSRLDSRAGPILADPERLQQAIWNLLSNAIKFTPRGGKVEVVLARANSHVEIRVTDTGQGIAPHFLPHVFERFRQEDATTTRKQSGLGLGLAIVRNLVEMHGGTVTAGSAGEGKGATFTILLPVARAQEVDVEGIRPASQQEGPFIDGARTCVGLRILVVDDDEDACDLIRHIFEGCGAVVAVVFSASEALATFETFDPHVLVSDIAMPEMDGYGLIRSIRATERGANVVAIALTAFARSEDRTMALREGYQAHLAKPVEPAELVASVTSLARLTAQAEEVERAEPR